MVEQVCQSLPRLWTSVYGPAAAGSTEDCLQEARLSIWRACRRLRELPEDARLPYAIVCARRAASLYLRREKSASGLLLSSDALPNLPHRPAQAAAVEHSTPDEWLAGFACVELSEEMRALPPRDLSILHLYYAHGMTDCEVAVQLESTTSAVVRQRRRLLSRLRRALGRGLPSAGQSPPDPMDAAARLEFSFNK